MTTNKPASFHEVYEPQQKVSTAKGINLADIASDPVLAKELKKIQADAYRIFSIATDDMMAMLTKNEPRKSATSTANTLSGATLARVGRRGSMDTKERLEYVRAYLAGALLNRNNPDWDPAVPSTDRADYDDPIVALMLMKLDW